MEKEDKILLASIEDKIAQCGYRYTMTNTAFLDLRQRALAEEFCRRQQGLLLPVERPDGAYDDADVSGSGRVRALFYGGYADAERRILLFLPDYMRIADAVAMPGGAEANDSTASDYGAGSGVADYGAGSGAVAGSSTAMPGGAAASSSTAMGGGAASSAADDCPLAVLKAHVRVGSGARKLTHRDYLGSLLALGIKREMTGDILVRDDGADIVILKEISEFLLANYEKAGRANLTLTLTEISALDAGDSHAVEKRDTVASLRLDSLVSSVFGLSRGKAQDAIKAGLVFVNSAAALKPDRLLAEGDKLVLRGSGKAILKEIGGQTRKDRTYVIFDRYL